MSRALAGRRLVIFGATGNVGSGLALAAVEAGAEVVLPTRSAEGAARLRAAFPASEVVLGDVSDGAGADMLAARIAEGGPIDHVAAALGAWWHGGRLVAQTASTWEGVRRMLLDSHVHAARTLLPRVTGSYLLVTGEGAVRPIPSASLLTIALGGTLALSRLLRAEYRQGPRVNELRIAGRIETAPRPGVVLARDFGRAVVPLFTSDVRGAIIPFISPSTFRVDATIPEE